MSLGLGVEEHISVSGRVDDTSQCPGHGLVLSLRSQGLEVKIIYLVDEFIENLFNDVCVEQMSAENNSIQDAQEICTAIVF